MIALFEQLTAAVRPARSPGLCVPLAGQQRCHRNPIACVPPANEHHRRPRPKQHSSSVPTARLTQRARPLETVPTENPQRTRSTAPLEAHRSKHRLRFSAIQRTQLDPSRRRMRSLQSNSKSLCVTPVAGRRRGSPPRPLLQRCYDTLEKHTPRRCVPTPAARSCDPGASVRPTTVNSGGQIRLGTTAIPGVRQVGGAGVGRPRGGMGPSTRLPFSLSFLHSL